MIREAKISDLPEIMELFKVVLADMEHPVLEKYEWSKLKLVLVEIGSEPDNKLGYPQLIVKEIDGEVAGYLGSYNDDFEDNKEAVQAILAKHGMEELDLFDDEAFENEWYLDCIVTKSTHRKKGVGRALLEAVYERAAEKGYDVVGLNCDQDNEYARAIYEKQGFKKVGEINIVGHMYDHMQKEVK